MQIKRQREAPAPFWRRLLAYAIDVIVVSFVIVIPFSGFSAFEKKSGVATIESVYQLMTFSPGFSWKLFFSGFIAAVLTVLYFALFEYNLKQTVGKMAMKIQVRSLVNKLSFSQALARSWTKISSLLLFFDVLYMFVTRSNLRCFERLSKTEVILAPKGGSR